jgi:hypothetical protein
MNVYYVYAYLDPRKPGDFKYKDYSFDHEPFYIGKGKENRINQHLNLYGNNKLKNNKIRKIIKLGYKPIILKLIEDINEEDAIYKEINLINEIGRIDSLKGPLTNLTNGGEGISGYKFSKEFLDRYTKKVIKYDRFGNILNEYNSVEDASISNNVSKNSIIRCCNGDVKFSQNKYIYLYENEEFKERLKLPGNIYSIYSIDMNGNKEYYNSSHDAAKVKNLNQGNISAVCKGIRFQCGGYLWRYTTHKKIEYYTEKIETNWEDLLSLLNKEIIDINGEKYLNILHCIINKNLKTNGLIRFLKNNNII